MCGIVGYVGKDGQAISKTISCLEKLEYRGYDSAGIAYVTNKKLVISKKKGRIIELKNDLNLNEKANIAIAHTRWATHGDADDINAHPHHVGHVTIVHNGIIENYAELKEKLINKGYHFTSQTDTEVACATIDCVYKKFKNHLKCLEELKKIFKGSYALGIIFDDDLNTMYAIRKDSPLILGIDAESYFIASDIPAILNYTNKYILLNDDEIVVLNNNYKIYKNGQEVSKEIQEFQFNYDMQNKNSYEHYMLKEINEQPLIISNLLKKYLFNDLQDLPDLTKYNRIDFVGCGSAYHTALIAKFLFEEQAHKEVICYIASEYRYQNNFFDKQSLVIFISQSGETADTLACLRKVKKQNIDTLAIVNALGSSIAREAKQVIYTEAGPEIAVATTKAYTAQITILALLALKTCLIQKNIQNLEQVKQDSLKIKDTISEIIKNIPYQDIAQKIYKNKDIFFIGRLMDYAIALEGSLKLKEISYINSETYPAGELKHGTISLVSKGTPIISVITSPKIKDKTISNIEEVKARGAYNIVVSNLPIDSKISDITIKIPTISPFLQPIITIIPLQLLAYHVAKLNSCDIDKPRNLAKSVTVE